MVYQIFFNQIAKDVAMGGFVTEEQAIVHAQYLDLIYPQSSTLYDLLPNALRLYTDPTSSKPPETLPVNGIIQLVTKTSSKSSSSSTKQKFVSTTASNSPSNPSQNLGKTSEVIIIKSTMAEKTSKGK